MEDSCLGLKGLNTLYPYPKGPCTQLVYTLAPKYLYRDYFKANVYTLFGDMDLEGYPSTVLPLLWGYGALSRMCAWATADPQRETRSTEPQVREPRAPNACTFHARVPVTEHVSCIQQGKHAEACNLLYEGASRNPKPLNPKH